MSYCKYIFIEKDKNLLLIKALMCPYFQNLQFPRILVIGSWVTSFEVQIISYDSHIWSFKKNPVYITQHVSDSDSRHFT